MSSFAVYAPRSCEQSRQPLPKNLAIAPATLADAAGIARLVAEREGITLDEALARTTRGLQFDTERANLVLLARLDDGIIGFGRARYLTSPNSNDVSPAWYLMGVIVAASHRRLGIATQLTRLRLAWIAERATEAYYFANSLNLPSIDLHQRLGFIEMQRPFHFPGATFSDGGEGVLFRIALGRDG